MKIGKLDVQLFDHPELGEVFLLKSKNNAESFTFRATTNSVTITISKETALLLAEYFDKQMGLL